MVCPTKIPKSVRTLPRLLGSLHEFNNCCFRRLHLTATRLKWEDMCDFQSFQSGHCSGTMLDVSRNIQEQFGMDPDYFTIPKCRSKLLRYTPKREDLPSRSMKDSFTTAIIPLSMETVRGRYVNHLRRVRMGRLMEELDLFAVWICHRHVKIPNLPKGIPLPYVYVTTLVDSVYFLNDAPISAIEDIDLCGHVSWTDLTSIEITIYIRQKMRTFSKAIFMMISRNATNTGPAPVNPLEPANEKEKKCFEDSVNRQSRPHNNYRKTVVCRRPTKEDEKLMFEIFKRTQDTEAKSVYMQKLPPNCRWMSDSYQTTMLRAFPDNRNLHNAVFGGFVMRSAVELCSLAASIYSGSHSVLECILDAAFFRSVRVNSFLKLTAYIVYTFEAYITLLLVVQVIDKDTSNELTTNALHIIYKATKNVEEVLPSTYQEALCYITGRNKFHIYQKLKKW